MRKCKIAHIEKTPQAQTPRVGRFSPDLSKLGPSWSSLPGEAQGELISPSAPSTNQPGPKCPPSARSELPSPSFQGLHHFPILGKPLLVRRASTRPLNLLDHTSAETSNPIAFGVSSKASLPRYLSLHSPSPVQSQSVTTKRAARGFSWCCRSCMYRWPGSCS